MRQFWNISILVTIFEKILISLRLSKNLDSNYKWRNISILVKFSKNLDFSQIFFKNIYFSQIFAKISILVKMFEKSPF